MPEAIKIYPDEFFQELAPEFLENIWKDMDVIKESIKSKNYHSIMLIGHSIAGCAQSYGFHELSVIGADMEMAANKSDIKKIKTLTEKMETYLNSVEIVYKS